MPTPSIPQLHTLHPLFRLGICVLIIVMLGGFIVSGIHMAKHYDRRDSRPGLTLDDITAAYHGINAPSPFIEALNNNHPPDLNAEDRKILLDWLASPRLEQTYDDLDLGDQAPAEIIAVSCLTCHARGATAEGAYPRLPLEYWDDVRAIAYSIDVQPNDRAIIIASLHAHAPSMAMILIVIGSLALLTRFPNWLTGSILTLSALGLLADMGGQWLAATNAAWVYAIVAGGFAYSAGTTLLGLFAIIGCWLPRAKAA